MAVFKIIAHPPTDQRGLKSLLGYVLQEEKTEEKLVSATVLAPGYLGHFGPGYFNHFLVGLN